MHILTFVDYFPKNSVFDSNNAYLNPAKRLTGWRGWRGWRGWSTFCRGS
jgi:hypothetical protein